MSVHFGMHISQIAMRLKLKNKLYNVLAVAFKIISAIGIYEFIKLKYIDFLFGRVQFLFLDTSATVLMKIFQYLSVMVLFAEIGYWSGRIIIYKNKSIIPKE